MAQALFDEHPLGEYLRDNGEIPLLIPGTCPELQQELVDFNAGFDEHSDGDRKNCPPRFLLDFVEFLQSAISSVQTDTPSPFVEKFKYNVISSSLLSPALPSSHSRRSSKSPSIPGKLIHSRGSSMDLDHGIPTSPVSSSEPSYGMMSFSTASTVALFSTGYLFLSLIALMVTSLLVYNTLSTTDSYQIDMTASFNALDDLIQANQIWESVVQNAVTVLESDERTSPPISPLTPSSHVRVALHSCLQTTHTQCDNIRNIFSALTSPVELSQLSGMYAPQSPSKNFESNSRPFSFPPSHSNTSPNAFTTPNNKRATWSGSYTSLASAGSPTHSMQRRRDRHRVGLPDLFGSNASNTPEISKDPNTEEETRADHSLTSSDSNHFGVAALELQRKRKSGALETFRTFSTAYPPNKSSRSTRNSMFVSPISTASKFTTLQPARHPLSFSALNYAVQGAIAAKRYTCSHLLALRFSDEEDEGYWEDVRSVVDLLTSTLTDASSRLSEALDEAEQQSMQDQIPIPSPMVPSSEDDMTSYKPLKIDARVSFAPMPNHISRFTAHVAAIGSALDDARDHLEQCVSTLKEYSSPSFPFSGSPQRSRRSRNFPDAVEESEAEVPVALQAFERLRRELGLALRECERGRDRLLEIVYPPILSDEEEFDDLPSLGHDLSDDSEKTDFISPSPDDESDVAALVNAGKVSTVMVGGDGGDAGGTSIDDATSHLLLMATSKHLPMPGIEEVFEAEMGTRAIFTRERSKLTREERIKAAQARREKGLGLGIAFDGGGAKDGHVEPQKLGGIEKWGPGGEVVQELKDVIWKVSEKRRKMADASQSQLTENSS